MKSKEREERKKTFSLRLVDLGHMRRKEEGNKRIS